MASYTLRPAPDEYADHFQRYIALVPAGDILVLLKSQLDDTRSLVRSTPAVKGDFAYAPGKWTVKEVIGHLADTERVMAYRALRISRGDQTPLASFEENVFVPEAQFGARTLASLMDEFAAVRAATVALFDGLPEHSWVRRGTASNRTVSVRALACIIAGHELHHRQLLRERYQL